MLSDNHDETTLREFPNAAPVFDQCDAPSAGSLHEALRIFRNVAGYDLKFVRTGSREALLDPSIVEGRRDEDVSPLERVASFPIGEPGRRVYGALKLSRNREVYPKVDWDAACSFAELLASMLAENYLWRDELALREGELAALVVDDPAAVAPKTSVAARLRDILRSGACAIGGFSAAALYLLDEKTSSLKTRAVWGLPDDRYLDPPRPLRGARAEVEALMGSAVTLNDDYLAEVWKAPESFACSVCIPVVSETTILGVAWFFADEKHDIGAREIETLDLVAWRLVDELEKEAASIRRRPRPAISPEQEAEADRELRQWVDEVLNVKG